MSTRVVLDTNVLISAFLFPGRVSDKAFKLCLSGFAELVTSPAILEELRGVLRRKFRFTAADADAVVAIVRGAAEVVEPAIVIDAVKADPADNAILECAVWGHADILVTGDRAHLLPLDPFRGIRIVTPRAFVTLAS